MDEQPIGRRIAYWRSRRKMSQQVFADRLEKSKSWVDKIERGVRKVDKFSVVYKIADVLQIDVQVLLGRDPSRRPDTITCIDQVDVTEIRSAMERYDKISAFFFATPEAPSLAELTKAVDHAWLTFQYSKYPQLARMLPKLLRDAQAANAAYDGDDGRVAAGLLGQAYQIASSSLRKLGEHDLAWLAADRAVMACQRAGDDMLCCLATTRVANALVALGRFRPALEIAVNIANQIAPVGTCDATPERLTVYAMVLLQGAMAAARMGDPTTVRELISAAEEAAKQLGGDENYYWTNFGPTNVVFHKVAADVELGEGGRAVETHETIAPEDFAAMMPERRAHHLLDLSRGLAQTGDVARAGEVLLEADRIATGEVRCRPIAHELLANILRRTVGSPPAQLAELADQIGLAV
ncbi:MAG TPA: helix-turn-helix domain-containing protein [Micromonosporaceae bacterium]|nr:helix-turn-helix domain-containing protein [Micromonosporaceae bacterium]